MNIHHSFPKLSQPVPYYEQVCSLENKDKWINKKVTINYNGKTAYGVPQYAQFNYRNCLRVD